MAFSSGAKAPAGSTWRSSRAIIADRAALAWSGRGPSRVTSGRWRRFWPPAAAVRGSRRPPCGRGRGCFPALELSAQVPSLPRIEAAPDAERLVGCDRVRQATAADGHCAQICRACVAGLSLGGKKIPGSLAVQSACTLHTRLVSAAACSRSWDDSSSRACGMVASSGMRKAPLLMGQGSTPRAYTLMWTMLLTLKLKFMDLSTGLSVQRRLSHLSSQFRPAAPVAEVWSAARRGGLCAICPCRGWLAGPRRSCLPPPGHFRSCP